MSGKSYSIKEMKTIVDYLIEHKLFGEIRGRKMWVDFANSQLTNRTWQSLKETFLKRILPDIHNPYYKLTTEQIASFRAGYDVVDRIKNKLEIQEISDDSNSNGNTKTNERSNNGNINEGETAAGEDIKCSKIASRSRSSADTVILDNCYETAAERHNDPESNDDRDEKNSVGVSKSFRDCITYLEPLTPMLQEVLDDFASEPEDSDRENQMEIVDSVPENDNSEDTNHNTEPGSPNGENVATDVAKNAKGLSAELVEEVLAQELEGENRKLEKTSPKKNIQNLTTATDNLITDLVDDVTPVQKENTSEKDNNKDNEQENKKNNEKENKKDNERDNKNYSEKDNESNVDTHSGTTTLFTENTEIQAANESHSEAAQAGCLNNSNSTVDASLPNNPEALKDKQVKNVENVSKDSEPEKAVTVSTNTKKKVELKVTRKRSCSENIPKNVDIKKKKLEIKLKSPTKDKETSESDLEENIVSKNMEVKTADEHPASKTGKNINKSENIDFKKPQVTDNVSEFMKPSTSHDVSVVDNESLVSNIDKAVPNKESEIKNPCLQNVSLFDEQFNKTKYNMSESSDTEQNKKETKGNKQEVTVSKPCNEVVELKSQSESDTEEVICPPKKKTRAGVLSCKSERDKAISNMFGFTSGGVSSKRKRQLSRRRRTISHNNVSHNTVVSNSSEWTSESDSDAYVSPPRSRKNRHTRKYLKPQSAKIMSLEEEGGLFVMYGKKIYPLVKDGKIVKNYLTYLPESDSDEGESYWKQKYEEEKKKAQELKKLLEQSKEQPRSRDSRSPILQANPLRNSKSSHTESREAHNDAGKEICLPERDVKKEVSNVNVNPPEKIKIKFTKNNEEVHLEGHWPQIHPVLEQVVQIFHKEAEPVVSESSSKVLVEAPKEPKELSSGNTTPIIITPVDPEIRDKVDKIETEIFKEIEERDKQEQDESKETDVNVTKRKAGKLRKSSTSVAESPMKRRRTSKQLEAKESDVEANKNSKQNATETENVGDNNDTVAKRLTRSPRKVLNESLNTNNARTVQTRRSKQNLDASKSDETKEDEEIKYMFPPKNTRQSLKASTSKKPNQKPRRSSATVTKIFSSPDDYSLNSIDSTQGYQDSDVSPVKLELRKKKKLNMSSFLIKTRNSLRRSTRRKCLPYLSCDSSNPSAYAARDSTSLNTEAYRSESYELLMPHTKPPQGHLEPIDETSPIGNEIDFVKHLEALCENDIRMSNDGIIHSGQMTSDVGSSSNVSLPMSPELSVVENMSISKDMLLSIEDYPTLNEMLSVGEKEPINCSKYMRSDVDVSVPLMQQNCGVEGCNLTTVTKATGPESLVTESLLSKIGTFNIEDRVADSLDQKLHDLLLESAKKITSTDNDHNKVSMMDIDATDFEIKNKVKSKKRCSTPRKRKGSQKSVVPKVDTVIEEQHVEAYSRNGRKSCPPLIETFACEETITVEEIDISNHSIANEKLKGRKKKNIIKVKIQRPKSKKSREKIIQSSKCVSKNSVCTDSGINDTVSGIFPIDDSIDLIHNHSETCLHANECVGDSIEFVDKSKSIITIGDSMESGDNIWQDRSEHNDADKISPELFCSNAQDVGSFYNKTESSESTSETVYHSPLGTEVSINSLMTEDLSDEVPKPSAPPTKWYLLSEDENTNTNTGQGSTKMSVGSFGSNLKQLFPITCAVPDLSTISEMSKENEDSRKPILDLEGLTGEDFNSKSVFDSNL